MTCAAGRPNPPPTTQPPEKYGANDLEAAAVDMVCEGLNDLAKNWLAAAYLKDENEKKQKLEAYFKDEFPKWAGHLVRCCVVRCVVRCACAALCCAVL